MNDGDDVLHRGGGFGDGDGGDVDDVCRRRVCDNDDDWNRCHCHRWCMFLSLCHHTHRPYRRHGLAFAFFAASSHYIRRHPKFLTVL